MLPFGLFTFLFGPLRDRYGKTRVIIAAFFDTAIFSRLGAFAFNLESLVVIRAINGALVAAILPVTMSFMGDLFPKPRSQMNAIGRVMGMFFLGLLLRRLSMGVCPFSVPGVWCIWPLGLPN